MTILLHSQENEGATKLKILNVYVQRIEVKNLQSCTFHIIRNRPGGHSTPWPIKILSHLSSSAKHSLICCK